MTDVVIAGTISFALLLALLSLVSVMIGGAMPRILAVLTDGGVRSDSQPMTERLRYAA